MSDTHDPAVDHFTFRTWPFYWLMRAQGSYLKEMEQELRPLDLDLPHWRVLMTLHEEGCLSVSDIADYAFVKLSTMTRIVQRMQADGLVVCRPRAHDGRVTEVLLTDSGEAAGAAAWDAANRVYRRAFRGISARRKQQLIGLLQTIAANLG